MHQNVNMWDVQYLTVMKSYRRRCFTYKDMRVVFSVITLCCLCSTSLAFNVNVKSPKVFNGAPGSYFGYSLAFLRNMGGNWLLVGAPKSADRMQFGVKTPGILIRCPVDGDSSNCLEVVVDTTGNVQITGNFYGTGKMLQHDKTDEWLGGAFDVSPSNDRIVVCAHRWKDAKFVARDDLLYMQGICYELDANFQFRARLMPILVDYWSLVHMTERYPIWAYAALGQSVKYTKNGEGIVMGAPGINDWQGGFVIEDNLRRNFTVQPLADDRNNWMIGYTVTTAQLIRTEDPYVIAGAPRANLNGSVYIFKYKRNEILGEPLIGDQFGSYFGSVLCAVDVNNDKLDDLIVGAPLYAKNNTDAGRVYVYLNRGLHRLELQPDKLNGTVSDQARFGSAIANIGDINKDSFNDLAIGAPYENDGEGAVYIYNGYSEGVWPKFTQRIPGSAIDPGIRAFGASLSPRPSSTGSMFAVGAYESDSAVILHANPVVAMDTKMYVQPNIITKSGPYLDLIQCFKYTGAAATLPDTLDITYTMVVDVTTPENLVRTIVVPNNVPYITRSLQIIKGEFVCDGNIRIYAPYQDIWRDVEIEVGYALDRNIADSCVRDCPILERFDGKDPLASTQDMMKKVIQYDKQCGDDNICDTGLSMKILPLANDGKFIVSGRDKVLDIRVGLINTLENAYNIILDVSVAGNLSSSVRAHELQGESIVDCTPLTYDLEDPLELATYRCLIRKPYPLKNKEELTFHLQFPLDNHMSMQEFLANFTLRTEDQEKAQATEMLKLGIKSQYSLRIEGISGPEQVTLRLQQTTNTWVSVEHRYSIKNLGPSPLEHGNIVTFVPAIIHRQEALVTNISVWITTYDTDPVVKQRCYESTAAADIPQSDSTGGYAITVDCSSFPCRQFTCNVMMFEMDESVLVTVNMSVSRQILTRLQAKDTVRLVSKLSIPGVNYGKSLDSQVETMFHKTTTDMVRKKINIPIWLIIVSVVSAFLVLLVIVAILIKVGFFKRSKKDEMRRLMSTRNSSPFSSSQASTSDVSNRVNGTSDNSKIMGHGGDANEYAHDNPVAYDDDK